MHNANQDKSKWYIYLVDTNLRNWNDVIRYNGFGGNQVGNMSFCLFTLIGCAQTVMMVNGNSKHMLIIHETLKYRCIVSLCNKDCVQMTSTNELWCLQIYHCIGTLLAWHWHFQNNNFNEFQIAWNSMSMIFGYEEKKNYF